MPDNGVEGWRWSVVVPNTPLTPLKFSNVSNTLDLFQKLDSGQIKTRKHCYYKEKCADYNYSNSFYRLKWKLLKRKEGTGQNFI